MLGGSDLDLIVLRSEACVLCLNYCTHRKLSTANRELKDRQKVGAASAGCDALDPGAELEEAPNQATVLGVNCLAQACSPLQSLSHGTHPVIICSVESFG
jgi:hypothetical protein